MGVRRYNCCQSHCLSQFGAINTGEAHIDMRSQTAPAIEDFDLPDIDNNVNVSWMETGQNLGYNEDIKLPLE